jgi:hypothetical protein
VRSSDRSAPDPAGRRVLLAALILLVASIASIKRLRADLAERYDRLRVRSDVYALPAPEQLIVASLGYRSALADLLYANTLVSYGIHIQERRRFEYVAQYLDAVTTLDPKFRAPFLYADTLLVMQAVPARLEDFVKARELLERGTRAFPHDAELWLNAGQFMAYLAVPYLQDANLKERWRLDGARVLAKSCEFVSGNQNIPYHCITAASLFSKAGEREATARFLERLLAVSDDEEFRAYAHTYLDALLDDMQRQKIRSRDRRFHAAWGSDLPFVRKDLLLVIGPRFDPARCAGAEASKSGDCATSWRAWAEHLPSGESP